MPRRNDDGQRVPRRHSPAKTLEERESVMISKSLNLVESQIDDGNVSATVLAQYVKLGSSREKLEQQRLRNENELLLKKVEAMQDAMDMKVLMEDAINSFRGYTGQTTEDDGDDYYD